MLAQPYAKYARDFRASVEAGAYCIRNAHASSRAAGAVGAASWYLLYLPYVQYAPAV